MALTDHKKPTTITRHQRVMCLTTNVTQNSKQYGRQHQTAPEVTAQATWQRTDEKIKEQNRGAVSALPKVFNKL